MLYETFLRKMAPFVAVSAFTSGNRHKRGIVVVGGIVQWRIVGKDGRIVEVMEVVGVEGSRVLFERYLPLHDTVLKRYRVANGSD